ncbi:MAG: YihY/virulence factor BrkB family protein [bacterium]|nr:YihY/virulence factor BrkB family protein [bacterium]
MRNKWDIARSNAWSIVKFSWSRFSEIDGAQRAGAFAYYAFFALFPLIILIVSIASLFIDRDQAGHSVLNFIQSYIAISGDMKQQIIDNITSVINARGQAGAIAFLMLLWVSTQFFTTMISATNRAWGSEDYNWWRMPFRSLILLAVTVGSVFMGTGIPMLVRMVKNWILPQLAQNWGYNLLLYTISLSVVFLCMLMFYKLAPRRYTRFSEVWLPALIVTLLLQLGEALFIVYLNKFSTFNAVYGTTGGVMALLLWIYLSGCIFIFGACLCAAQAEGRIQINQ